MLRSRNCAPRCRSRKQKFTGRLRHCQGMYQTVDLILGVMAAVATALLMGLIARDNIGMPPDMVREHALIAASSCCRRRDVTRERKQ